jgi:hypothetical protein
MVAALGVVEHANQPMLVAPPRGAERGVGAMDDAAIAGEGAACGVGDDLSCGQNAVLEGQTINSFVALSVISG